MSANTRIKLHKRLWILFWHWWRGGIRSSYTKVWTSQDGRQTPICYLEDRHLRNILRLLMRRQMEADIMFQRIPRPQGEMAALEWDNTIFEEIWNSKPRHPLWQDLVNEAYLRGIQWYNEKRGDSNERKCDRLQQARRFEEGADQDRRSDHARQGER